MGILEQERSRRAAENKILVCDAFGESVEVYKMSDPRIIEITEKAKKLANQEIKVYFSGSADINKKGFYNCKNHSEAVLLPESARNLPDEEILSLILAEAFFKTLIIQKNGVFVNQKFYGDICRVVKVKESNLFFRSVPWRNGSLYVLTIMCFILIIAAVAVLPVPGNFIAPLFFIGFIFIELCGHFRRNLIRNEIADAMAVSLTNNKQSLINALLFMKESLAGKQYARQTQRNAIDRRIKKLSVRSNRNILQKKDETPENNLSKSVDDLKLFR